MISFLIYFATFCSFILLFLASMVQVDAGAQTIDLLNKPWSTINFATVERHNGTLNITANVRETGRIYNGAFHDIKLPHITSKPVIDLTYLTNSSIGNPRFIFEIRAANNSFQDSSFQLANCRMNSCVNLWSQTLGNTLGYPTSRSYYPPPEISNLGVEMGFYIISNGPTDAYITVKEATIREQLIHSSKS